MAWTSPRSTARLTSDSALTPGKVLVMERISRMWSLMDSVVLVLHAGWVGKVCSPRSRGARAGVPSDGGRPEPTRGPGRSGSGLPDRSGPGGAGSVGLALGDLVGRPVTGVDQLGLDVVLVDRDDGQQVRRDDLDTVVVGLGVVGLRLVALQVGLGRGDGLLGQLAGVLEDGAALDTVSDELDRGDLGVLAGDDRHGVRLRVDRRAVAGVLQGGDDAAREAVVRGQDAVDLGAVVVAGGEQVLHALL